MAHLKFFFTFVLFVTHAPQSTVPQFIEMPVNTAAHVGDAVRLNCTVDWSEEPFLEWTHNGNRIFDTNDGIIQDPDLYDVIREENGQFDLIVRSVQPELSGFYVCSLTIADDVARADVVSVEPMMCPDEGQVVNEGDILMLHCGVNYRGYKAPTLVWTGEDMIPLDDQITTEGENSVTQRVNETAAWKFDEYIFTCHLSFQTEDGDESEAPEFTDTCHTHFFVNHAVTDMQFEPDPDSFVDEVIELYVGEHINCTASGRPGPTFSWWNSMNEQIEEDWQLHITSDLTGQHTVTCEAKNIYQSEERTVTREVTFRAEEPPASQATSLFASTVTLLLAVSLVHIAVGR